jgi:hypothetical protein
MNDDIEKLLSGLTPRGAGPELRPRVLAAVAEQLQAAPSPWLRRSALAVAASLLVGIALNVWVNQAADRRLVQLLGPLPPASQDAQRALAEYNAVLQELIAETQNPAITPRPAAAPRGADDRARDGDGFMLNGAPARPPAEAWCC